ncbi:MAG: hypothetical protein H0W83_15515, partial [Planctomycetes bacterium]|nr:hypothetical protein [Planctomycetota bacterium]
MKQITDPLRKTYPLAEPLFFRTAASRLAEASSLTTMQRRLPRHQATNRTDTAAMNAIPNPDAPTATLLISCKDRPGLVARMSNFIFVNGGNILDLDQHSEIESGLFFMRVVWSMSAFKLDRAAISSALAVIAGEYGLTWEVTFSDV